MTWSWGTSSQLRLDSVNAALVDVLNRARARGCPELTIPPYGGSRTLLTQQSLVGQGTSWTLDSKHRVDEIGHHVGRHMSAAVDVAPYPIDWDDTQRFEVVAAYILGAAAQLGIPIIWGGMWSQKDYGHFELKGS